ncbi:MAG: Ig-like domain-containing protein [Chthoniobacteraceae bacterium]
MFYRRLAEENYVDNSARPWTASTSDDSDFSLAALGQAKYVFGFGLDASFCAEFAIQKIENSSSVSVSPFAQPVTVHTNSGPNDVVTYTILQAPSYGTLSGTGPNYTYIPNAGYSGVDYFVYNATKNGVDSNAAQISFLVADYTTPLELIYPQDGQSINQNDGVSFVANAFKQGVALQKSGVLCKQHQGWNDFG